MGHISPLMGIINNFKEEYQFVYFGLKDSMEEDVCKKNNIEFYPMKLLPFYRNKVFKNFLTFFYIFKEKRKIRKKYKKYDVKIIITSGGFVSIPLMLSFKNTKKLLLESNTTLGLANLFLGKYANYVGVQFDSVKHSKKILIGNPILIPKQTFDHPFLYLNKPKILFVGGSNGALEIVECALRFNQKYPNIKLFVITGKNNYDINGFNNNVRIFQRIENLSAIMHYFTLVVSRAGAATITELLMEKVVFVLYPSKNVSDNHQVLNAQFLKDKGVCEMIMESNEDSLSLIYDLLFNKNKRQSITSNQNAVLIFDVFERLRQLISN